MNETTDIIEVTFISQLLAYILLFAILTAMIYGLRLVYIGIKNKEKWAKITMIKIRALNILFLLLLSHIVMYIYTVSRVAGLEYYNAYLLGTGIYSGGFVVFVYIIANTLFLKKIIQNVYIKFLASVLFFVFLTQALFAIVGSVQINFGTTWTQKEVLFELVLHHKNTIIWLILATIVYYIFLSLFKKRYTIKLK